MKLTDTPLSQLNLPKGIIIAAIHRGDQAIIPKGDTVIKEGDQVIILSLLSQVSKLEKYFQAKMWNFSL